MSRLDTGAWDAIAGGMRLGLEQRAVGQRDRALDINEREGIDLAAYRRGVLQQNAIEALRKQQQMKLENDSLDVMYQKVNPPPMVNTGMGPNVDPSGNVVQPTIDPAWAADFETFRVLSPEVKRILLNDAIEARDRERLTAAVTAMGAVPGLFTPQQVATLKLRAQGVNAPVPGSGGGGEMDWLAQQQIKLLFDEYEYARKGFDDLVKQQKEEDTYSTNAGKQTRALAWQKVEAARRTYTDALGMTKPEAAEAAQQPPKATIPTPQPSGSTINPSDEDGGITNPQQQVAMYVKRAEALLAQRGIEASPEAIKQAVLELREADRRGNIYGDDR